MKRKLAYNYESTDENGHLRVQTSPFRRVLGTIHICDERYCIVNDIETSDIGRGCQGPTLSDIELNVSPLWQYPISDVEIQTNRCVRLKTIVPWLSKCLYPLSLSGVDVHVPVFVYFPVPVT